MKKLGFYMAIALFIVISGCNEYGEERLPEPISDFMLWNKSNEATHMWIEGEVIMPGNKIEPGEVRVVSYTKSKDLQDKKILLEPVSVYAGRDGAVLTSTTVNVGLYEGTREVEYNGSSLRIKR